MTFLSYIIQHTDFGSANLQLSDHERELSDIEVYQAFERYSALAESGLKPGSILLVQNSQSVLLFPLLLAASRHNWVLVPVDNQNPEAEHDRIVKQIGPSAVLDLKSDEVSELSGSKPHNFDCMGVVFATSGTTGLSKYVFVSEKKLLRNIQRSVASQQIDANSHIYSTLAVSHSGGLCMQALPAFMTGARVSLHNRFEPKQYLDTINRLKPTHIAMVPSQYRILKRRRLLNQLKLESSPWVLSGSEPIPDQFFSDIEALGGRPIGVYGMTEAGPFLCTAKHLKSSEQGAISFLGEFFDDTMARLSDEGEILVRQSEVNPYVDCGGDEVSLRALTDWLPSGDIALQKLGAYFFCHRKDDQVNKGGFKFFTSEVRQAIESLEGIEQARVFKVSHPLWGEAVEAEVVLSDQRLDAAQLRGQLRKRIASYKLPQALHFVRSIETTLIGKVKN